MARHSSEASNSVTPEELKSLFLSLIKEGKLVYLPRPGCAEPLDIGSDLTLIFTGLYILKAVLPFAIPDEKERAKVIQGSELWDDFNKDSEVVKCGYYGRIQYEADMEDRKPLEQSYYIAIKRFADEVRSLERTEASISAFRHALDRFVRDELLIANLTERVNAVSSKVNSNEFFRESLNKAAAHFSSGGDHSFSLGRR